MPRILTGIQSIGRPHLRIFLLALVLLPQFGWAQLDHFESGSYVLATAPEVRQVGEIKVKDGNTLVVKTAAGQKITLMPEEIVSFRMGLHQGTTESVKGLFDHTVRRRFVELLDSGQVLLMRHDYYINDGRGSSTIHEYLVRTSQQAQCASLLFNWLDISKELRATLLPYLVSRPDLAQLVSEHNISSSALVALVHALNSGQQFGPPLPPPKAPKKQKEQSVENPFGID